MADCEMNWSREIERLEELAAIQLSEKERGQLVSDLQRIVEYVKRVSEMKDEDGVDVVNWRSPLLEDIPKESLNYETIFSNAPKVFCDMFIVPPIIEERR